MSGDGRVVVVSALLAMLAACGGGPDGPDAGDSGADGGDAGAFVTPPDIPWLDAGVPPIAPPMPPVFTPCPEGWQEVVREDGTVTCDPYPDGRQVCPAGDVHFVGEAGCTPVGAACPAGDFPEGLPTDVEVLYVLGSAPAGGDGSEAAPYSTITEAMNVASPGTVIAIGKGAYDEPVLVGPGVTLFGACAGETRLTTSSPPLFAQGVITVPSADVQLINLGVGPADLPGVVVFGTRATASIDGLLIEGVQNSGLYVYRGARVNGRGLSVSATRADSTGRLGRGFIVETGGIVDLTRVALSENHEIGLFVTGEGASLTLSDIVVEATQAQVRDGTGGRGLSVQSGAAATVTRGLFAHNRDNGVYAAGDGTSLTLTDVVVEDTLGQERAGVLGRGLTVQRGATAELSRVRLSRNREAGVYAAGVGTSATLSDVVVEGTRGQESDGRGGRGLGVQDGATVTVARAFFTENRETGVFPEGAGTSVTLSDVVVEGTQGQEIDGTGGRGLNVQFGATAELSRVRFSENYELGVYVAGEGTSVTLSDAVVEDTRGQESDTTGGRGLNVQDGATAEVSRARLSQNRELGMYVAGAGTLVTLTDVIVEGTRGQESDGAWGRGLNVQTGATVTVVRTVLSGNRDIAVYAAGEGAALALSDVVVEGTQSQERDGIGGRGLNAQDGATVTVARTLFSGNRDFGVFASQPGTSVQLSDVVVVRTSAQACASTTCSESPFGVGAVGILEARLGLTRFEVLDSALCGVMVADGGEVDLSMGRVSGSPVGVCLQVDGYAVSRLTQTVRYVDNGTNLDATSLPVPAAATSVSPVE